MSALTVRPCAPDDLPGLCAAYNGLVVGRVPHCGPVAAGEMGPVVAAPTLTLTIEREGARLAEQAVLVAGEGGAVGGFIHVGLQAPDERGGLDLRVRARPDVTAAATGTAADLPVRARPDVTAAP